MRRPLKLSCLHFDGLRARVGLAFAIISAGGFGCQQQVEPAQQATMLEARGTGEDAHGGVRLGAAVLLDEAPLWTREQRLALLTNAAARVDGEVLAERLAGGANLVRLFAAEHGFALRLEAGAKVERESSVSLAHLDRVDVRSWYGVDAAQRIADLEGIDVLLFDLPDVGARYFTYVGTMRLAMEAAAAAGVRFVVLDRPNPLGGELVSGWIAEAEHRSLVASLPIPILHGMTVGEIALMIRGEEWIEGAERLDLEVVELEGWERSMRWSGTRLPWFAASPNLPSFHAALVYGGTCLFEGTILSEGRGTEDSFLQFGSPALNAADLLLALRPTQPIKTDGAGPRGVELQAVVFTPRSLPGRAASPRFVDQAVNGVHIRVIEEDLVRPLELGVTLLRAVVDQAGAAVLEPRWLAKLAGTERLGELLSAGASAEQIIASWSQDVVSFRELRRAYLLYPEASASHD